MLITMGQAVEEDVAETMHNADATVTNIVTRMDVALTVVMNARPPGPTTV